jgi:cell volume regulation protein A
LPASEFASVALYLTAFALLLVASVLLSGVSERTGIPLVLLFLTVGVLAGRQGLGHIAFTNYRLAFAAGTAALVLILFDGGLNTPLPRVREAMRPAVVLATVGVLMTTGLVAACARLFGFSWTQAFLEGAIVSSTDAAMVFSVLRGSGLQLKKRVATVLELESGLNDPMAVALTVAFTQSLIQQRGVTLYVLAAIPVSLLIGALFGIAIGYGGRLLLRSIAPPVGGLFPVLTLALALLAYGLPTLIGGSGFLSVYVAAVVLGNGPIPYRAGIARVHDSVAWFCQISMFLLLGLLALPSQLLPAAPAGVGIALFLALVARPLSVLLCLFPFRYAMTEIAYVGWVGLRGAVPIVLAIYPALERAPGAAAVFNLVFFVVVVNALVPGATVRWVTRRLGLRSEAPLPPSAVMEITSTRLLGGGEVRSFPISASSAACGAQISELPFPSDSAVILVLRGHELIAPRGSTRLLAGDHVYLLVRPEDESLLYLIFGRPESE